MFCMTRKMRDEKQLSRKDGEKLFANIDKVFFALARNTFQYKHLYY